MQIAATLRLLRLLSSGRDSWVGSAAGPLGKPSASGGMPVALVPAGGAGPPNPRYRRMAQRRYAERRNLAGRME